MAKRNLHITARDYETLSTLDQFPLTPQQLLKISQTFDEPFSDLRYVRRRLHAMKTAGFVQSWPYLTATDGRSPHYFKLTRDGYRLVYGDDVAMPNRRYFEAIAPNHHFHSRALADFVIHLAVTANSQGITMQHFARENSLRLNAGGFSVCPDAAFQLVSPHGRPFNFVVELDNSTERVRSRLGVESIERKIRGYELHQEQYSALSGHRYVVLFVTTRSQQRLFNIMDAVRDLTRNPQRQVFLGTTLGKFTSHNNPILQRCCIDHEQRPRPLIRIKSAQESASENPQPIFVTPSPAVC